MLNPELIRVLPPTIEARSYATDPRIKEVKKHLGYELGFLPRGIPVKGIPLGGDSPEKKHRGFYRNEKSPIIKSNTVKYRTVGPKKPSDSEFTEFQIQD